MLLYYQTSLIRKSNGVICSVDADFCLRETDNPYDYNDDNNDSLDNDKNRVYLNRRKLNFKGKEGERVRFPQPLFIFIYDII